jgi:acetylornithine/succinyldiaminopimelate/putrescine aminotransferase
MSDNTKSQELIEEMRGKGNLPAINENVQAITQITRQCHHEGLRLDLEYPGNRQFRFVPAALPH